MMFWTSQMLSELYGTDEDFPHYTPNMMPTTHQQQSATVEGNTRPGIKSDARSDRNISPKMFSARFVDTNIATRQKANASVNIGATSSNREIPRGPGMPTPSQRPTTSSLTLKGKASSGSLQDGENVHQYLANRYAPRDAVPKTSVASVPKQSARHNPFGMSMFSEKAPNSNLKREKSIQKGLTFADHHPSTLHQTCDDSTSFTTTELPEVGAEAMFGRPPNHNIAMSDDQRWQGLHDEIEQTYDFLMRQYIQVFGSPSNPGQMEQQPSRRFSAKPVVENNVTTETTGRQIPKPKTVASDHPSEQILNKLMDHFLQRRKMLEVNRRKRHLDAETFANYLEMLEDEELKEKLQENKFKAQEAKDSNANTPSDAGALLSDEQNNAGTLSELRNDLNRDNPVQALRLIPGRLAPNNRESATTLTASNFVESGTQTTTDSPVVCLRFRVAKGQNVQKMHIVGSDQGASDQPTSSVEETRPNSRKRQRRHTAASQSQSNLKGIKRDTQVLSSNDELPHRFALPLNSAKYQEHDLPYSTLPQQRAPTTDKQKRYTDHALTAEYNSEKTYTDNEMGLFPAGNWSKFYEPHAPVQHRHERLTTQNSTNPFRRKSEVKIMPLLGPLKQDKSLPEESPERNIYEVVVQLEVDKDSNTKTRASPAGKSDSTLLSSRSFTRQHVKVGERYKKDKTEYDTISGSSISQSTPGREKLPKNGTGSKKNARMLYSEDGNSNKRAMPQATTIAPGVLWIGEPRHLEVYYNLASDTNVDVTDGRNYSRNTETAIPFPARRVSPSQRLSSIDEREAVHSLLPPTVKLLIDSHEKYPAGRPSKYNYNNQVSSSSDTDDPRTTNLPVPQIKSETSLESEAGSPEPLPLKHTKSRVQTHAAAAAAPPSVKPKTARFSPETWGDYEVQKLDNHSLHPLNPTQNLSAGLQLERLAEQPRPSQTYVNTSIVLPEPHVHTTSETKLDDQRQQGGGLESYNAKMTGFPRNEKKLSAHAIYNQFPPKRAKFGHDPSVPPVVAQSYMRVSQELVGRLRNVLDTPQQPASSPHTNGGSLETNPLNTKLRDSAESQRFSVTGPQFAEASMPESSVSVKTNQENVRISSETKNFIGRNKLAKHMSVISDEGLEYGNDDWKSQSGIMVSESPVRNTLNPASSKSKRSVLSAPSVPVIEETIQELTEMPTAVIEENSESDEETFPSPLSSPEIRSLEKNNPSHREEEMSENEDVANFVSDLVSNLVGSNKIGSVDVQSEAFRNYVKASVCNLRRIKSHAHLFESENSKTQVHPSDSVLRKSQAHLSESGNSKLQVRDSGSRKSQPRARDVQSSNDQSLHSDPGNRTIQIHPSELGHRKNQVRVSDSGSSNRQTDSGHSNSESHQSDSGRSKSNVKTSDSGYRKGLEHLSDSRISTTQVNQSDSVRSKSNVKPSDSGYRMSLEHLSDSRISKTQVNQSDSGRSKSNVKTSDSGYRKGLEHLSDSRISTTQVNQPDSVRSKSNVKPSDSDYRMSLEHLSDSRISKTQVNQSDSARSKSNVKPSDSGYRMSLEHLSDSRISKTQVNQSDSARSKSNVKPSDSGYRMSPEHLSDSRISMTQVNQSDPARSTTQVNHSDSARSKSNVKPSDSGFRKSLEQLSDSRISTTQVNPSDSGHNRSDASASDSAKVTDKSLSSRSSSIKAKSSTQTLQDDEDD